MIFSSIRVGLDVVLCWSGELLPRFDQAFFPGMIIYGFIPLPALSALIGVMWVGFQSLYILSLVIVFFRGAYACLRCYRRLERIVKLKARWNKMETKLRGQLRQAGVHMVVDQALSRKPDVLRRTVL